MPMYKGFSAIPELPNWGLDSDRIPKLVLGEIILSQKIQMPPGSRRAMGHCLQQFLPFGWIIDLGGFLRQVQVIPADDTILDEPLRSLGPEGVAPDAWPSTTPPASDVPSLHWKQPFPRCGPKVPCLRIRRSKHGKSSLILKRPSRRPGIAPAHFDPSRSPLSIATLRIGPAPCLHRRRDPRR